MEQIAPTQPELSDFEIREYISTVQKGIIKLSIGFTLLALLVVFISLKVLGVI